MPRNVDTDNMYTPAREVDTVNMVEGPGAARRYHHGNLRAALIETAVDQARAGGADVTCWAAVHGFAVLCLQGPLRGLPEQEREAQLDGLLERVARGL